MKLVPVKIAVIFAFMLILFSTALPGCSSPAQEIKVDLAFAELPVLNKPVKLTETFTLWPDYYGDLPHDATAHIYLPDSFIKVDGEVDWQGQLSRGQPQTLTVTVKSTQTGSFEINANAGIIINGSGGGSGSKYIYITISETEVSVNDSPPWARSGLSCGVRSTTTVPGTVPPAQR